MEQLIPYSYLSAYKITSRTLLPDVILPKETKQGLLEIRDDDDAIRAFLVSKLILANRPTKSSVLRNAMAAYAKSQNKRLIYTPS